MEMNTTYCNFKLSFLVFFLSVFCFSQTNQTIWTQISFEDITQEKLVRNSEPTLASYFSLNIESLKSNLSNAPNRDNSQITSSVIVNFPNSNGSLESFAIKKASVLGLDLQSKYPNILSFVGVSTLNPSKTIRFSISQDGLHAVIFRTETGTQIIDPYTKDRQKYIVYSKKNAPLNDLSFVCEFENNLGTDRITIQESASILNDGNLKTFRLALACTGEYAQFHLTDQGIDSGASDAIKKAAVLSAMNTTMTRVNGVYENDLSITMTLVDNNSIIYLDGATDPYTNSDGITMLGENQTTIDTNIGTANYDIGHVFSTGGGGVASLNSPCNVASKARGVTGLSSPIGDVFDIDFVSHEMGHQFGANHTFNGDAGSCGGGNRNDATAFEPGSGSTIMAYAGICSPQNVQNNSDAYFHIASIEEIIANVTSGVSTCAALSSTGNTAPTINNLTNYTIPKSTPFILKGSGNDIDGTGTLSYSWEQKDNQIATMPPVSTATNGPLFRSLRPSISTERFMPRIGTVLGVTSSTWEVLPSVARTLNFDLTVRDNDNRGGRTTTKSMVVTVEDVAPFIVTAPNIAVIWGVGTTKTITWDVGSTTNPTINCQNVNIKLSTDGGLRYPIMLVSNTPNDGTQDIVIPNNMSTSCRIMVEAADNIFYDISDVNFTIAATDGTPEYCPSTYTNGGGEQISNVTFNTINNDSGKTANGYEDYTTISTDVELNLLYPINVEINTAGNFTHHCEVFIDWNQDYVFDPVTEYYYLGSVIGVTAGILSTNITVPSDAVIGNTRMRINIEFQTNPGACDADHTTEWGETEDYTINILNNLSVKDEVFENFSIFPNPNNGTFTVSFKSELNETIEIQLFDILGKNISTKIYKNNTMLFKEQLLYENLSKGIYILKIFQNNKTTSKQLIIN